MNVRTVSQPSKRLKPKDAKEKKVVFKGALDNPFRIQWPSVSMNLQNNISGHVVQNLEGSSEYISSLRAMNRKRKRTINSDSCSYSPTGKQPRKAEDNNNAAHSSLELKESSVKKPTLLPHLIYGINEVTKWLEIEIHRPRRPVPIAKEPDKLLRYILVCRDDVDPPLLVDHLPRLVAAYNSIHLDHPIKLAPLPRGSENVLALKLGIRRVTVLAIDMTYPNEKDLWLLFEDIPIISFPWLSTESLIPTHIKLLRTTAPIDMKMAKELRMKQKAVAKLISKSKKG